MSHRIKIGEWIVYHNVDFSGDATICPPESMQIEPLNVPMEVLRAIAGWDDEAQKDVGSMEVQEQAFAWRTIFDWCEAHGCDYLHDGTSLENTIAFLNGLVETDDEGWIEWDKGYCPPGCEDKVVEIRTERYGDLCKRPARMTHWERKGDGNDITHYRVVEQPPAKYRPFASAAEFKPHRDRWLRCKEGHTYRAILVSELGVRIAWMTSLIQFDEMFNTFVFDDNNEPCGVRE